MTSLAPTDEGGPRGHPDGGCREGTGGGVRVERTRATRTHRRYYVDGVQVPGATTILSVLNKPALVKWANSIGLEGVRVDAYVDSLAAIGTAAHSLIEARLRGEDFDAGDFTPNEIASARRSAVKYEEWTRGKDIIVRAAEQQFVSCTHLFGGTADAILDIDGVSTLVDFKTGKGIYAEHAYQASAYAELAKENGWDIRAVRILNIPRAETESFQERVLTDWSAEWRVFLAALEVYKAQRDLRKQEREAA